MEAINVKFKYECPCCGHTDTVLITYSMWAIKIDPSILEEKHECPICGTLIDR